MRAAELEILFSAGWTRMPRGVRHNTAARGHERPKPSRDGVAATKKGGWSACQEGWLGPASPRGERGPTSPRAAASAHRAPLLHSQPPEGPGLRSQGDLDAGRGRRTLSARHPPHGPKPAPSRRPAGRRRPAVPRRTPRGPGQGSARPGIRPPRNNGRRGCGGHGGRGGAGAPGRWKPRPSAGSLTTRAGPRRLLPAPQRSTPGGAPAGALQQQPLLCRAGPGVGAGASSFPPSPAAMSQGSPGDWAPLDPTPGSPAPPNPFVHELHLSRLQRVKVKCEWGASGGLVGIRKGGSLEPTPRWGWGSGKEVGERLAGRVSGGAHVGAAGGGEKSLERARAWAMDSSKVWKN